VIADRVHLLTVAALRNVFLRPSPGSSRADVQLMRSAVGFADQYSVIGAASSLVIVLFVELVAWPLRTRSPFLRSYEPFSEYLLTLSLFSKCLALPMSSTYRPSLGLLIRQTCANCAAAIWARGRYPHCRAGPLRDSLIGGARSHLGARRARTPDPGRWLNNPIARWHFVMKYCSPFFPCSV